MGPFITTEAINVRRTEDIQSCLQEILYDIEYFF